MCNADHVRTTATFAARWSTSHNVVQLTDVRPVVTTLLVASHVARVWTTGGYKTEQSTSRRSTDVYKSPHDGVRR